MVSGKCQRDSINIFVMLAQLAQVPMPWKSYLQGVIQEHFLSQLIFII